MLLRKRLEQGKENISRWSHFAGLRFGSATLSKMHVTGITITMVTWFNFVVSRSHDPVLNIFHTNRKHSRNEIWSGYVSAFIERTIAKKVSFVSISIAFKVLGKFINFNRIIEHHTEVNDMVFRLTFDYKKYKTVFFPIYLLNAYQKKLVTTIFSREYFWRFCLDIQLRLKVNINKLNIFSPWYSKCYQSITFYSFQQKCSIVGKWHKNTNAFSFCGIYENMNLFLPWNRNQLSINHTLLNTFVLFALFDVVSPNIVSHDKSDRRNTENAEITTLVISIVRKQVFMCFYHFVSNKYQIVVFTLKNIENAFLYDGPGFYSSCKIILDKNKTHQCSSFNCLLQIMSAVRNTTNKLFFTFLTAQMEVLDLSVADPLAFPQLTEFQSNSCYEKGFPVCNEIYLVRANTSVNVSISLFEYIGNYLPTCEFGGLTLFDSEHPPSPSPFTEIISHCSETDVVSGKNFYSLDTNMLIAINSFDHHSSCSVKMTITLSVCESVTINICAFTRYYFMKYNQLSNKRKIELFNSFSLAAVGKSFFSDKYSHLISSTGFPVIDVNLGEHACTVIQLIRQAFYSDSIKHTFQSAWGCNTLIKITKPSLEFSTLQYEMHGYMAGNSLEVPYLSSFQHFVVFDVFGVNYYSSRSRNLQYVSDMHEEQCKPTMANSFLIAGTNYASQKILSIPSVYQWVNKSKKILTENQQMFHCVLDVNITHLIPRKIFKQRSGTNPLWMINPTNSKSILMSWKYSGSRDDLLSFSFDALQDNSWIEFKIYQQKTPSDEATESLSFVNRLLNWSNFNHESFGSKHVLSLTVLRPVKEKVTLRLQAVTKVSVLVAPCCCKERLYLPLCDVVRPVVCRGKTPTQAIFKQLSFSEFFFTPNVFSPPKLFSHIHFFLHFWVFHAIMSAQILWVKQGATQCCPAF